MLAIEALVTVSPFTRPLDTNSVPAKVKFCPYVLLRLVAVTPSGAF